MSGADLDLQDSRVEVSTRGVTLQADGVAVTGAHLRGVAEPPDVRGGVSLQQAGHDQQVLLLLDGRLLCEVGGLALRQPVCTERQ